MKKEDIHLYDWQRILIGEVPGIFYVEILIRAAAVYLLLVLSMRLMGRRMASQLSRNEMAAMISMAAAIGVPILDAHRGLLPAYVIGAVVVFTQRIVSYWAAKNQRFEAISQGDKSTIIENSVIQLANMKSARLSRELLFAQLRSGGLAHLGHVKRLYMEANGAFTLIEEPKPIPGLSILPEWDTDLSPNRRKRQVNSSVITAAMHSPIPIRKETIPIANITNGFRHLSRLFEISTPNLTLIVR